MIYPEGAKAKWIVTKVVNYIVGQEDVPDHDTMQEKALEIFLKKYRSNLVGLELSHHLDIVQTARRIAHIFRLLYIQRISQSREQTWIAGKLPAVSVTYTYMYIYTIVCWCAVHVFCHYSETSL
jgi:hypothetical protein